MGIVKEVIGTIEEGKAVTRYTLENQNGMKVSFLDLGAVMVNLWVPDREGHLDDIVHGYDDLASYLINVPSFGAPIGRYANRISEGKITINKKEYMLDQNDETNCLHGGKLRYNHLMYEAEYSNDNEKEEIAFFRLSPDGEQGFPGNMNYGITYCLTDNNELILEYVAVSDQDTVVNMTNHSYFNLGPGGHKCKSVLNQEVMIHSEHYTPVNDILVPTGDIVPVKGTPMDFTCFKPLGRDLNPEEQSTDYFPGYDHNFMLDNPDREMKEAAWLRDWESGRTMRVLTDQPGLQMYTAPALIEPGGKQGVTYGPSSAVCFESQNFPNAVNTPGFPDGILRAGEIYHTVTVYQFGLI